MYSGAMGKMIAGILIKTQNEDSPLRVSLFFFLSFSLPDTYLIVRQRFYSFPYLFAYGISFICVFWF